MALMAFELEKFSSAGKLSKKANEHCVLIFVTKIQFTSYLLFDFPAYLAYLLNFAKILMQADLTTADNR